MGSPKTTGKEDTGPVVGSGDSSSGDGLPDSNSNIYTEGEKVQKAEIREKEWRYFVHYLGWNKNWDEWVGTDRLLKYTAENIQKQQTLAKKPATEKNLKSGRSAQAKPKVSNEAKVEKEDAKPNVVKGKKRKADSGVEKENTSVEKTFKIQIPIALRKQLVDDWEFVNQQDKLVKLPRSPTVDEVLAKYLEYRSKKDGMLTDSVAEVLNGLRSYFDKALPLMLLYKKERQQYHEAVKDDRNQGAFFLSVYTSSKGVEGNGKGKAD
ncbi:hypothetical protein V2J09_021794 [Rumex salicifolius]